MLGISGVEFLVILLVAALVIPASGWPAVAKFLAKCVKFVRGIIWKITDASEQITEQIEREIPIDKLSKQTMDDVMAAFAVPAKPKAHKKK